MENKNLVPDELVTDELLGETSSERMAETIQAAVMKLGHGMIAVRTMAFEDKPALVMYELDGEPRPIGPRTDVTEEALPQDRLVSVLSFANKASVDVIIKSLNHIRRRLTPSKDKPIVELEHVVRLYHPEAQARRNGIYASKSEDAVWLGSNWKNAYENLPTADTKPEVVP